MRLRVATRGSRLSLAQTRQALEHLSSRLGEPLDYELVIVRTRGDVHQDKPFTMIGGKGLFEKEVNRAVLEGRADIAVHSLKDVPSDVSPGLVLAYTPPRESPYDVLVARDGPVTIWGLPRGAVVGTSSARRAAFLRSVRSDLVIKPLRGNVDTRLRKLREGQYDAIVLAEAGLRRLGAAVEYWRFPPDVLPPAPGQGIVAAYTHYSRADILPRLRAASDPEAYTAALAERAFLAYAGGGCHTPLGADIRLENDALVVEAAVASPDGSRVARVRVEGDPERPAQVGIDAALELRAAARREGVSL